MEENDSGRIRTLDILRGIAVMGILGMNIVAFAMPEAAYTNPAAYGGAEGLDRFAWFLGFILLDGKMRGFFSLLFGASMILVIDRAEAKGENGASVHFRRMAWLLALGLVHLYLIWWGDILTLYALCGMTAWMFHRLPKRGLLAATAMLLALQAAQMAAISRDFLTTSHKAAGPAATADDINRWDRMKRGYSPSSDEIEADIALHRSGYREITRTRLDERARDPVMGFFFIGAETLAYMLIGMLALRGGFLTGAWAERSYRRVAFWCLLTGGGGFVALAWLVLSTGFDTATLAAVELSGTELPRLLMILGYAALAILLTRGGGRLVERIAAAGQMAFTNYLGTSLVMTILFYGYGFGLYGRLDRAALYPIVVGVWAFMLLWSKPWLDRFCYGPFEWLWRSLARWKLQPMRRPLGTEA